MGKAGTVVTCAKPKTDVAIRQKRRLNLCNMMFEIKKGLPALNQQVSLY
jgi:hypothetical protein